MSRDVPMGVFSGSVCCNRVVTNIGELSLTSETVINTIVLLDLPVESVTYK